MPRSFLSRRQRRSGLVTRKLWVARGGVAMSVAIAISLLIFIGGKSSISNQADDTTNSFFSPVVNFLSKPASITSEISLWFETARDNGEILEENKKLMQWQEVGLRLQAENKSLREMLNMPTEPEYSYVTAEIIGNIRKPYQESFTVMAGQVDGIRLNMAVISPRGLVGRVSEVGKNTSRILSIIDVNSRIPVVADISREKAIIAGNNSNVMSLKYLSKKSNMAKLERIVTTSDVNGFPAGIMVGEIISVGDVVKAKSYVDWSRLEYVKIVIPEGINSDKSAVNSQQQEDNGI